MSDQPAQPGSGKNGRWVNIGSVSVDGAMMGICDPGYAKQRDYSREEPWRNVTEDTTVRDWCSGVEFLAGFGDGGYDVWAWVVDYGDGNGGVDERVAQVVVTLIDDEDVARWNVD